MDLKELRKSANMTQKEVAKKVAIRRASYANIENGSRKPSVKVAKRVAKVLGFEWTQFYE